MGIVSMNCPNCGAQVDMDDSREFGYCSICGSKVMVDRMIVEHKGSVKIDTPEADFIIDRVTLIRYVGHNYDVIIPSFIQIIGNEAFYNCDYIKSITIPTSVTKIGDRAFGMCTSLKDVIVKGENYFDSKVLSIGDYAFARCIRLPGITIKRSCNIGSHAFEWCSDLTSVTMPNVYSIGDSAFFMSKNITDMTLPSYIEKVGKYNGVLEKYTTFQTERPSNNSNSKELGHCYVATCVYGSYDCPQVWTLRRYRDDTLASTWYGRAFIRTYYAVSPTLVKWFGKTKWFKKMWQGKLDRKVRRLNASGVADTPYNDKQW